MIFGPCPVDVAEGAILAHSLTIAGKRFKKGMRLRPADITALVAAGVESVTVARLAPDDLDEDTAAARLADALQVGTGMTVSAPFTGRVNVHADRPGVISIDSGAVAALNSIDPAITCATLPDLTWVSARSLLATVKIIPYAVPAAHVQRAMDGITVPVLCHHPVQLQSARLIMTRTAGFSEKLLEKGAAAVRTRLDQLGVALTHVETVDHAAEALARAIKAGEEDLILILTASATSDANDVGPSALRQAGGQVARVGMPVDPGNLLFLGDMAGHPVIGLPGCARSPALNGADWVLQRVVCGLPVTSADIASKGVGGLLKEIPTRPQARAGAAPTGRPVVELVLLAAGAGVRMRGGDKHLEPVNGIPLLRHLAQEALGAQVDRVQVCLPPQAAARAAALNGLDVTSTYVQGAAEGMAASLRAALAARGTTIDALIILPADMPGITAEHINRLIAAFDPTEGRDICRAVTASGIPGHPVLFGKRFFESLARLTGDIGARDLIRKAEEFVIPVQTPGEGAALDLDTPEAWAEWRARS